MKIVTVIGARPQFIKAAAVSRAIASHNASVETEHQWINEIIVHTGQHFDRNMSDVFFEEMEIPRPDCCLEINSLSHGAMTGRMLEKAEEVLLNERPDFVMVYGDTNSTLAGALAAKKLHIKVVHVEAGLRSFKLTMPEEINRILTDRISDILCCPTDVAVENLRAEGFDAFPSAIVKTGDVMLDAALYYAELSTHKSTVIQTLNLENMPFALCTIHRAENTDDPGRLSGIVQALNEIASEMAIVLPMHPRTRKILAGLLDKLRFTPIDPVGYFDMLELLKNTKVVLTDSGGLQKEAFFFKKPCITLRNETEWIELVEGGYNHLVGADKGCIVEAFRHTSGLEMSPATQFYGAGDSSKKVLNAISARA